MAYASALRKMSDVMIDDHIKIGENGLLYRVSEIESYDDTPNMVWLTLYYAGDDSQKTIAHLALRATENVMIYNQD